MNKTYTASVAAVETKTPNEPRASRKMLNTQERVKAPELRVPLVGASMPHTDDELQALLVLHTLLVCDLHVDVEERDLAVGRARSASSFFLRTINSAPSHPDAPEQHRRWLRGIR